MMKVKQRIVQIRLQLLDALANIFAHIHWYYSDERHNPYRCPICGGTDIHIRAWLEVNRGNRYVGDCEDTDRNWCESCQKMIHTHTTDWFEDLTNEWWDEIECHAMERITGYHQSDFDPKDSYQDFVDACNEWWGKQTSEKKIKIWNNHS